MYCVFLPIDGGSSRWQDRVEGSLVAAAPLARYTSYRAGGPAKYLLVPATARDVEEVFAAGERTFVMGAGSNLLVADAGFDGVVIRICDTLAQLASRGREVVVGAGRRLASLVKSCGALGLGGLEWAGGLPGTVGGAACTNAGAFGGAIWDVITSVELVAADGSRARLGPGDVAVAYRTVRFPVPPPFAVTEVAFELTPTPGAELESRAAGYRARRLRSQPLDAASAGCVFRNPPGEHSAGELIERAGLKGLRRGEAAVSGKHANFIVNEGGATAADIYALIGEVREKVKADFDVTLEREIELLGDFG